MPLAILHRLGAFVLIFLAIAGTGLAEDPWEKEAALKNRLKTYLPHTYPKLERRARIRVSVVGDSIGNFYLPVGEDAMDVRKSWHWKFLSKLGARFFYGGGVRNGAAKAPPPPALPTLAEMGDNPVINLPPRGHIPELEAVLPGAPEIVIQNFSKNGAISIQADQSLTTIGFDDHPDLVIWMYGVNDANTENPLEAYRDALLSTIHQCQQHGADLIIAGPSLIYAENIVTLARTLPYSQMAKDLAAQNGFLFIDMASALGTVSLPETVDVDTAFPSFLKELLSRYEHKDLPEKFDGLHPNAEGHEVMAEAAWKTLSAGAPNNPFEPRGSFTLPSEGSPPVLEIMVRQAPTDIEPPPEMTGVLITPLSPPGGWKRAGESTFEVKPFVDHKLTRMPLEPLPNVGTKLPLGKTIACGFIIYHEQTARLFEIPALVLPLALNIPAGRIEGVAGDLLVDCTVSNAQSQELRAPVKVKWLGKEISMDVAVEANASKPLRLRLPLPPGDRAHETLTVSIANGDKEYSFSRTVDATRNLLPSQKIALNSLLGQPPGPTLQVKTEPMGLFCTFELPPPPKTPSPTLPSATIFLMIDARSATERSKPGYVDPINFDVPWQDGPIELKRLRPAAFGNGYDREINPASIRASVKTEANGHRLVQIDIHKNAMYLHGWSLADKGQNTLGFNAAVSLIDTKVNPPNGGFTAETNWQWAQGTFGRVDASALGVLQLSPKASGEWSVRIF